MLATSAFLEAELAAVEVLVRDELQLVLEFNGSVGQLVAVGGDGLGVLVEVDYFALVLLFLHV